jgi:hypothetical protein
MEDLLEMGAAKIIVVITTIVKSPIEARGRHFISFGVNRFNKEACPAAREADSPMHSFGVEWYLWAAALPAPFFLRCLAWTPAYQQQRK